MTDLDDEMGRRLDEHPELIERLKAGDASALEDIFEVCTGAKIRSVTVRTLPRREVAADPANKGHTREWMEEMRKAAADGSLRAKIAAQPSVQELAARARGRVVTDYGKSIDGVELTEELLEKLADEAEAGYDVEKLKPRTREASQISPPDEEAP